MEPHVVTDAVTGWAAEGQSGAAVVTSHHAALTTAAALDTFLSFLLLLLTPPPLLLLLLFASLLFSSSPYPPPQRLYVLCFHPLLSFSVLFNASSSSFPLSSRRHKHFLLGATEDLMDVLLSLVFSLLHPVRLLFHLNPAFQELLSVTSPSFIFYHRSLFL